MSKNRKVIILISILLLGISLFWIMYSGNSKLKNVINLCEDHAEIKGKGAYEKGNTIYIVKSGSYYVTGNITGKCIQIDADDKVDLILHNANISNWAGPAIYIKQSEITNLILDENTVNSLIMGDKNKNEKMDGCIISKQKLTISGQGTLEIDGKYKHAIVCNDMMEIVSGNIDIKAVKDGIHVKDEINVRGGHISLDVLDDGITVDNDDDNATLLIEDGEIEIKNCYEGLEAKNVILNGGNITINSEDDGINASGKNSNGKIDIHGGNITIVNSSGYDADGMDANGSINIFGGNIFISVNGSQASYAIDFDNECIINGGEVLACGGNQMLEEMSPDSKQGFLVKSLDVIYPAGTKIELKDSANKSIVSQIIPCDFSAVTISTPEIIRDRTYTLIIGDSTYEILVVNE